MSISTGYITKDEAKHLQDEDRKIHISTKMNFLLAHNGLRPGCIHTILGTTGGGKSTLTRSIIRDFAFNKENSERKRTMLVLLSEETVDTFRTQLSYGVAEHERMFDIKVISEFEVAMSQQYLEEILAQHQPDVFLYDNLTTSKMYEGKRPHDQTEFCWWLKNLASNMKMATILVSHTTAEINDSINRLITTSDVRGSKTLGNISEFFYILQTFQSGSTRFPCLNIAKARGQEVHDRFYYLVYEKMFRQFTRDYVIQFDKVKEYYGKRNKL